MTQRLFQMSSFLYCLILMAALALFILATSCDTKKPPTLPVAPSTPVAAVTPAPTTAPSPTGAARSPVPTVTASKTGAAQTPAVPSLSTTPQAGKAAFAFSSPLVSFTYDESWRISGQTDRSVTFTLKEAPGKAQFMVQWHPVSGTTDTKKLFVDRLRLIASKVQQLPDIAISGISAQRYVSLFTNASSRSNTMTMNVLFESGGTAYLVTFAADPETFGNYAAQAEKLIATLTIP